MPGSIAGSLSARRGPSGPWPIPAWCPHLWLGFYGFRMKSWLNVNVPTRVQGNFAACLFRGHAPRCQGVSQPQASSRLRCAAVSGVQHTALWTPGYFSGDLVADRCVRSFLNQRLDERRLLPHYSKQRSRSVLEI